MDRESCCTTTIGGEGGGLQRKVAFVPYMEATDR